MPLLRVAKRVVLLGALVTAALPAQAIRSTAGFDRGDAAIPPWWRNLNAAVSSSIPIVVLAAGLGSRFGGVKPIAPVGPQHEPLIVIALRQAAEAGFTEAVVVTGDFTDEAVRHALDGSAALTVRFERQPERRAGVVPSKPWGTVAAVLAAKAGDVFVSANGDDLYGVVGLRLALQFCTSTPTGSPGDQADAAMIGYQLDQTVPPEGGVSRGIAVVDTGEMLSLVEHRDVRRVGPGFTSSTCGEIAADATTSMNLWAFRRGAVAALRSVSDQFIAANKQSETAELGLPDAIGRLVANGLLRVAVRPTTSPWHGVTWPRDVAGVRAALTAEESRR